MMLRILLVYWSNWYLLGLSLPSPILQVYNDALVFTGIIGSYCGLFPPSPILQVYNAALVSTGLIGTYCGLSLSSSI